MRLSQAHFHHYSLLNCVPERRLHIVLFFRASWHPQGGRQGQALVRQSILLNPRGSGSIPVSPCLGQSCLSRFGKEGRKTIVSGYIAWQPSKLTPLRPGLSEGRRGRGVTCRRRLSLRREDVTLIRGGAPAGVAWQAGFVPFRLSLGNEHLCGFSVSD